MAQQKFVYTMSWEEGSQHNVELGKAIPLWRLHGNGRTRRRGHRSDSLTRDAQMMHAALQILELLELIFSHISEENSLNALARTCRAFLEPALGRLWERIVTLEPFILLLSESKRQRDSDVSVTQYWGDDDERHSFVLFLSRLPSPQSTVLSA